MASKKDGNGSKRGNELVDTGVTDIVPVKAPDLQSFVENVDMSWLDGIKIERIVRLEDGQGIRNAAYLGVGPTVEVNDPTTGEVRDVPTHRFEIRNNVVIRLIESSQLKRELATYAKGTLVRVIKLGQVDTRRGRRVNDYIVAPEPNQVREAIA